jgi:membrane protease YdiL (CAAX protease family)
VGTRFPHYLTIVFLLGSFAAFCEEFYFRRVLFTMMQRSMSSPAAVVISVTLFALWHPNAYANPGHMGAIVSGGVFYSVLLIRHGSASPRYDLSRACKCVRGVVCQSHDVDVERRSSH